MIIKPALLEPELIDRKRHMRGSGRKLTRFGAGDAELDGIQQLEYPSLEMLLQIQVKAPLCPGDSSMVRGNDSKWPQLLSNPVLWLDYRGHLIRVAISSAALTRRLTDTVKYGAAATKLKLRWNAQYIHTPRTLHYTCLVYRFLYMYVNIQKKVWKDRN